MINKTRYVFIIGAGASIPYGFPSGKELYNIIKRDISKYVDEYISNPSIFRPSEFKTQEENAKIFSDALYLTNGVSLDKYININKKFESIGINAIATAILKKEKTSLLPISGHEIEDDWYSYVFQKMIEGLNEPSELIDIYKNKVTFITFNYDRSLEQYFYSNLHGLLNYSGIDKETITNSVNKIEILHVYGQIGLLPWQICDSKTEHVLDYGECSPSAYENGMKISNKIDIMYSKRKNSEMIKTIQQRIQSANRILFLGFGFDDMNMRLLGFPIDLNGKKVKGTAYQKTINEILNFENKITAGHYTIRHQRILEDSKTTKLLRDYLE